MTSPLTPAPISPVQDIVAEMRAGRMVILIDEEDRENEGDLVLAADHVTPEAINFMARFGRGLICLTLTRERCEFLKLPPMAARNGTVYSTAFTVSIEAAEGVTTGISAADRARTTRIAVIGLRGAGKSALGQRLAQDLGYAFIELSREIEQFAGCSINEIHNLYGTNAYRRYERRALEEAIQIYPEVVTATPGGLVADAANFNLLLQHCYTIWLQADPGDHMGRVAAQGDMRPMAASAEAMEDLKRILAGRSAFYAKADLRFNTSDYDSEEAAFRALRQSVQEATGIKVQCAK